MVDGRLDIVGGQQGQDDARLSSVGCLGLRPRPRHWSSEAALPFGRSHIGSATFAQDGRILVVGGEVKTSGGVFHAISDVVAYDPAANTWTALTPLPQIRRSGIALPLSGHRFLYSDGDPGPGATYDGDRIATPTG